MKNLSITQIKNRLDETPITLLEEELKKYRDDSRKGVQNLIKKFENKVKKHEELKKQYIEMSIFEKALHSKGIKYVAGIDEVGRGPLAGPVVSAAVILPDDIIIPGINDSKKLSESKREELYEEINKKALAVGIGIVGPEIIDTENILEATKQSMKKAIDDLQLKPEYLLIDALILHDVDIPQKDIIKGDSNSVSIAAASIIAKVTRDRMMLQLHDLYPGYYFDKNKGYGTKDHLESISKKGLCPIHRRSFTTKFV